MTLSKYKKSKQFRKNQSGGKEEIVEQSKCDGSLLCDLREGKIDHPKLFKLTFIDKDIPIPLDENIEPYKAEVCFQRYTDQKDQITFLRALNLIKDKIKFEVIILIFILIIILIIILIKIAYY